MFFFFRAKLREKSKAVFDLPERLEKKWDEMNIKRLMKVLMQMKMVDPQLLAQWTKPEKDKQIYNEKKRQAIAASFRRVNDDIVALRARLLPVEPAAEDRQSFVRENLKNIFLTYEEDDALFDAVGEDALTYVRFFLAFFGIW